MPENTTWWNSIAAMVIFLWRWPIVSAKYWPPKLPNPQVQSAQINIADNKLDNLIIARLSSEEFVQALRGEREFERLRDVDLNQYDFRTILVDPPRAGLDDESVRPGTGVREHYLYFLQPGHPVQ